MKIKRYKSGEQIISNMISMDLQGGKIEDEFEGEADFEEAKKNLFKKDLIVLTRSKEIPKIKKK